QPLVEQLAPQPCMVASRVICGIDRLILRLGLWLSLRRRLLQLLELLGQHIALGLELGRLRHVVLPLVPFVLQRPARDHRLARRGLRWLGVVILRLRRRRRWRGLRRLWLGCGLYRRGRRRLLRLRLWGARQ